MNPSGSMGTGQSGTQGTGTSTSSSSGVSVSVQQSDDVLDQAMEVFNTAGQGQSGNKQIPGQSTSGSYGSGQTTGNLPSGSTGTTANNGTGTVGSKQSTGGIIPGTSSTPGQTGQSGQSGTAGTGKTSGSGSPRVLVIGSGAPVATDQERVETMDRELDKSMGVFDGVILSKRQEVIARTNETGAGQIPAGSSTAANSGSGSDAGSVSPPLLTGGSGNANQGETNGAMPDAQGDNRKGEYQNKGNATVPADISDGSDDDIVARQLREAAMQEKDPVLREKLWNEYRKYKEGVQAKK